LRSKGREKRKEKKEKRGNFGAQRKFSAQKMASYLHHTATTVYPCCVPALGDSTGAGCVGLAAAKIRLFKVFASIFIVQF